MVSPTLALHTDEEIVLDQLERVVRWAEDFRLVFVQCNVRSQQETLRQVLRARLGEIRLLEIVVPPPPPLVSVLDVLTSQWDAAHPPQVVCIYNREQALLVHGEASPVLGRLNNDRDLIRRAIPAALLLWLPRFALDYVARGAPDFWAWRSGVYSFLSPESQTVQESMVPLTADVSTLFSSSTEDKYQEIARLQALVQTSKAVPQSGRRDREAMSRRYYQLGVLYENLGEWDAAHEQFTASLALAQQLEHQESIARALGGIARLQWYRSAVDEALRLYEEQLQLYTSLGKVVERADTLGDIARLQAQRGDVEAALALHQERLAVYERLGEVRERAVTLWDMAQIELSRGQVQQAAPQIVEAYQIVDRLGSLDGICVIGAVFGQLLIAMGQRDEGLAVLRRAEQGYRQLQRPGRAEAVATLIAELEQGS
jgi:tetratricopeptide (TPR) repeat protein